MEEVHIGGHILCNQMGGGQSVKDKHCNSNNEVYVRVHSYQVWVSDNYNHKLGGAFYK